MQICFISCEYPPLSHGGMGSVTQVLGRALVRNGHSVSTVGFYQHLNGEAYEEDQGVKVWRFEMPERRFGWIGARYRLFQTIARWARSGQVDLVEVPDWEGWAAWWPKLPVPVVVRLHGSSCYFATEIGVPFKRKTYWIERACLTRSDYYCSTSKYTADRTRALFGLPSPARAVIYNPVELPEEQPFSQRSTNSVIYTGTLTKKKGVISLIDAWARVHDEHPAAELHIFGKDGLTSERTSMREYLTARLRPECRDSVVFHGHVRREQILQQLHRSRVAVFPSYAEAFAMAPLESMAQGCPTIYSRRGSGPELIENGVDGLLVDPDAPAGIARAILDVLRDDGLAYRLSRAGVNKIRTSFSPERILAVNERFYADCIGGFAMGRS